MYDNLPFRTVHKPTIEALIQHEKVDFINSQHTYFTPPHQRTGEQKNTISRFKYYNLTFIVKYDSDGELIDLVSRGSFHYLKNEGKHNANNITLYQAMAFLNSFESHFEIELKYLKLLPFEFAQMINIPFDIEDIVDNTFCEERKMFNNNSAGNPSKISGKPSNDYRMKIYGKYAEHPEHCLPNNLRMEYQAKKMRVFKSKIFKELYGAQIETMADLLEIKNWFMLRDMHIERCNQIVIFDSNIDLPKNSKYKKELISFSNYNYWKKLVKDCKVGNIDREEYNKKVNTLRYLSKKYGKNIHEVIIQLVKKQWSIFLNLTKFSDFEINRFSTHAPLLKNTHAPFIGCIPCEYFRTKPFKYCLLTGEDISMQKRGSKLLSNTGLKHLEKTNLKKFNELKSKLLTGQPNHFEKDIYSMMSKQIRNRYYNTIHNFNSSQVSLF